MPTRSRASIKAHSPTANRFEVIQIWIQQGFCDSQHEAEALWSDLCHTNATPNSSTVTQSTFEAAMSDYFDVPSQVSRELWNQVVQDATSSGESDCESESDSDHSETTEGGHIFDLDDDHVDKEEVIGPGECELCERYIVLTRHHLIPRSTWPRIEPRLLHAAHAWMEDESREQEEAYTEWQHFRSELIAIQDRKTLRRAVQQCLQHTTDLCRPCHSAVHKTHDNITLAWQYNTVEKLLADPNICKFAKWAHKQKTGKHARGS